MVHECLTDGGIDPSDIDNVMSAFKANSGKSPQQSKFTKDLSLLGPALILVKIALIFQD